MLRETTAASPERRAAAMAGLAAYQAAARVADRRPLAPIASIGPARLLGPVGVGHPLVLVPSLVNPAAILDLDAESSLLRWLGEQGFAAHLIDWGTPDPADRALDLDAHVTGRLVPLLARFDRPPLVLGYCLGGTLALAAAAHVSLAGLALVATPWRFSGFGDAARQAIADLWNAAQPASDALGLVPMEVLQSGFWRLDPERTIAKYERFATLAPDSAAAHAFVRLEDWANGGAPIPYAAGRQMFDDLFDADLPGSGRWRVGGRIVDPAAIACPMVEFVSTTDRIVPAASAIGLADHRRLSLGHVGMIVGSRARDALWRPLSDWLSAAAAAT
jgi:polyhydroxyalkanoate synthase subunit PhaC